VNALLFILGLIVSVITAANVLFALVLPRRPRGFERISLKVNSAVRLAFIGLSQMARRYEGKDAILAPTGPVCVVAQLVTWAGGFIVAFALMLYSTTHSFANAFLQATTSLFTVGHRRDPADRLSAQSLRLFQSTRRPGRVARK
jgi:hypothetical protein